MNLENKARLERLIKKSDNPNLLKDHRIDRKLNPENHIPDGVVEIPNTRIVDLCEICSLIVADMFEYHAYSDSWKIKTDLSINQLRLD